MSLPVVVAVAPGSPAALAGLAEGDEVAAINGRAVRDIIEYRLVTDDADPELTVHRGGLELEFVIDKPAGKPLGLEIDSALFDKLRTCDNHCAFCFIYQLPAGLRPSLYQKDDDYRLSFLYGNFTTLTRFTEADLERVVTEGLSPLYVSIHATDPDVRSELLRNRRGAMSLRWLRALLDHGIEVHGQIVVCPGVNDGAVLDDTLCGVLDEYPELASVGAVPLGVSRFNRESTMRAHTPDEAAAVLDTVHRWQETFRSVLGRRMVFAADEYYLLADRPFPEAAAYESFPQHENGVGMAATFQRELSGESDHPMSVATGFFAWVDGAPPEGYRAPRTDRQAVPSAELDRSTHANGAPVAIVTGRYGEAVLSQVLPPVLARLGRSLSPDDVRIVGVENEFFGGNTGVAGLLVGADLARALEREPEGHRYLIPDVCLTRGRFLDGLAPADLPRAVEVIVTNGVALRQALDHDRSIPAAADHSAAVVSSPSERPSGATSPVTFLPRTR